MQYGMMSPVMAMVFFSVYPRSVIRSPSDVLMEGELRMSCVCGHCLVKDSVDSAPVGGQVPTYSMLLCWCAVCYVFSVHDLLGGGWVLHG